MKNKNIDEIMEQIKSLQEYCEGAMMAAKNGDYLHNFSFCIQERLRIIECDLHYLKDEEDEISISDVMAGVL